MTIIGITGTIGAGKGTVVAYLEKKGFKHFSARKFIVAEIERRKLPISRSSMVTVANELRAAHSPSYIIEALYEEAMRTGQDAIIESVRTEGEVVALREKNNFYLLAIDADQQARYRRIVSRGNETDHISFEKFIEDEEKEMHGTDPWTQNISRCIELADYKVMNNDSVQELENHINDILGKIAAKE